MHQNMKLHNMEFHVLMHAYILKVLKPKYSIVWPETERCALN